LQGLHWGILATHKDKRKKKQKTRRSSRDRGDRLKGRVTRQLKFGGDALRKGGRRPGHWGKGNEAAAESGSNREERNSAARTDFQGENVLT